MDTQNIFLFAAVALIILGSGVIFEQSYEENLDRQDVTNETVNVSSFDTPINLTNSQIDGARYDAEIDAWNSSDTKLITGTDYVWHDGNGTIEFVSGSANLSLGENTKVTYGYLEPSGLQFGFLTVFDGWLPALILVIAVFAVLSIEDHLP